MFFRFVTKHACDGRIDRQTDRQTDRRTHGQNYYPQDRASIAASRGKSHTLRKSGRVKFGTELGFAKSNYKITSSHRYTKVGVDLVWEAIKNFGSPLIFMQWLKPAISNLVHTLGLPIH